VEFFRRLALPVGKKCIVSIQLYYYYYSVLLRCNMLWTEESVIPSGQDRLVGWCFWSYLWPGIGYPWWNAAQNFSGYKIRCFTDTHYTCHLLRSLGFHWYLEVLVRNERWLGPSEVMVRKRLDTCSSNCPELRCYSEFSRDFLQLYGEC